MADPRFSVGIYICDGCDEPVNLARLILLRPNAEKAAKFRNPEKLRGVLVAFCKHCNKKEEVVSKTCMAIAQHYNRWVESQT